MTRSPVIQEFLGYHGTASICPKLVITFGDPEVFHVRHDT